MLRANRAPFGDGEELTEDVLRVPLWVHFPGGAFGGKSIRLPTGNALPRESPGEFAPFIDAK